MYKQRPDGPSYQNAWEAFTGLFDKERRGKPEPQPSLKRDKDEDEDEKRKKSGKR